MTANTSATGGPLLPPNEFLFVGTGPIEFIGSGPIQWLGAGPPPPLEDDALDDFFQALVVGCTGLPGTMVRPRFQLEPPNLPADGTNWCAVGIVSHSRDTYASVEHDPIGEGWDRVSRGEDLELLCSFYGPNSMGLGAILDDGLMVAQNREALYLAGMQLTSTSDLRKSPEMIQNRWLNRADITVFLRRQVVRYYPVRSLVGASLTVSTGANSETVTIAP